MAKARLADASTGGDSVKQRAVAGGPFKNVFETDVRTNCNHEASIITSDNICHIKSHAICSRIRAQVRQNPAKYGSSPPLSQAFLKEFKTAKASQAISIAAGLLEISYLPSHTLNLRTISENMRTLRICLADFQRPRALVSAR